MNEAEAWSRLASSPIAILGTINDDGTPHLVPFTFAVVPGDRLVSAVDSKPKSGRKLRRLTNLESDDRVTVLAEHYERDWDRLWWVRASGTARVQQAVSAELREKLITRYDGYGGHQLGPFIIVSVSTITGWSAAT